MPAKAMIRPEALPRQPTAIVRGGMEPKICVQGERGKIRFPPLTAAASRENTGENGPLSYESRRFLGATGSGSVGCVGLTPMAPKASAFLSDRSHYRPALAPIAFFTNPSHIPSTGIPNRISSVTGITNHPSSSISLSSCPSAHPA